MQPNEAILVVLLAVLIVMVAFQGHSFGRRHASGCPAGCGCTRCRKGASSDLYTPPHMQDGAIRGARHDVYHQDHANPADSYQSRAAAPRDLEEAQRAAWFEAVSNGHNAHYDPEAGGNTSSELVAHHTPGPSINYQDVLVDLVADPRMRAQQANWHSEVAPKSQTSMRVDTIDEAAAMSALSRHGLYSFRLAAPSQHNPLFVTDQDAESYGVHATGFRFGK